jgi:hypothetical protein
MVFGFEGGTLVLPLSWQERETNSLPLPFLKTPNEKKQVRIKTPPKMIKSSPKKQ